MILRAEEKGDQAILPKKRKCRDKLLHRNTSDPLTESKNIAVTPAEEI